MRAAAGTETELVELRAEVERLRAELSAAGAATKAAELAAGDLRGQLVETNVALARALQMELALRATFSGRVFRVARRGVGSARRVPRAVITRLG
jgi:hypothetical protein